jgi:DNA-binding NtrC family response regulator
MMTNGLESLMVREDGGFVGGICPAMQTLETVLGEIAPTNIPVLLVGESGTGKATFAQRLHRLSARAKERLVSVACAAMNPTLLMAELELGGNGGGEFRGAASTIGTALVRRNQRTRFRVLSEICCMRCRATARHAADRCRRA